MRSRLKAIVAALCTLALAVTPVFAAWGDTSSGEMSASGQTFKTVSTNGNMSYKRIDTFVLDGEDFYKSLGGDNDDTKPTLTLSSTNLQNIVKNDLLPQWSGVAASVFRDQAGQLVDLYGYKNNGGNMSQAGFDAYYNVSKSDNKDYEDETWSCNSLRDKLKQTWATHSGDPGWDQLTVTGVKRVNSLNGARDMVGQALYDCENHKGLKASEFLDVDEGDGSTRLEGLDDDESTTGFANVVTSVNCKGASANFDYVSFGIVFYDFEPVPVAAHGLNYIMGGVTETPGEKGTNSSVISNGQQQDVVHAAALGDAVTETTSTTLSGLASFNLKQNIGANIGWSETESSSDTSVSMNDDGGLDSSTSSSSSTESFGLNWGAAWEMGGALGAEAGHSQSQEVSKAVETTIALPAHTAAALDLKTSTTTYGQNYQQPVILNYKVAIFAVSGDFYSGGSGGINPGSYDKQSLVIKFDTKSESRASFGCAATDDLYSRVVTNKTVNDYDVAGERTYSTHSTASGWNKSTDINWDNVISTAKNYYGVEVVGNVNASVASDSANTVYAQKKGVARTNYFYETMGNLNVAVDKTSSSVSPMYPLYDLDSVKASKTKYVLYTGNKLDRSSLALQGYNRYSVPFYGFSENSSKWGGWQLCDEEGALITETDAEKIAEINALVDFPDDDTLEPKSNTNGGAIHLKWVFNENATVKTGDHPNEGEYQQLKELNSSNDIPIVTIEIKNTALDKPTVTAKGSYVGYYGTPINLNDVMTYEVTDETDKKIDAQVRWDSRELTSDGIIVDEGTGNVRFTKPGAYLVRPFVMANPDSNNVSKKVYSAWLPVVATEHNLVHYDAKASTDCTGGDADGWKEHYRCSDCGKYFSDAVGNDELSEEDVIIEAPGHAWGDWETIQEASSDSPGFERRVCENRPNHVETHTLYYVKFDPNGGDLKEPENEEEKEYRGSAVQTVVSGTSVKAPNEPTLAGHTFAGWYYKDAEGDEHPYVLNSPVTSNLTVYAKWDPVKYMVATVAVKDESVAADDGGVRQNITPAASGCTVSIADASTIPDDEGEGYTYYYTDVEPGQKVTLTVNLAHNFGLKEIQAIPVMPGTSVGELVPAADSLTLERVGDTNVYEFTMPAADVAVVGSFFQEYVDVTFIGLDGQDVVQNLPFSESDNKVQVKYGSTLELPDNYTGPTHTNDDLKFVGWFDKKTNNPWLPISAMTADTTLYAAFVGQNYLNEQTCEVTYKLSYPQDAEPASDEISYRPIKNSKVFDPTDDLYAVAGQDALTAYDLKKDKDGNCWFTDEALETPFDFETRIGKDTKLYAQVVPRKYTVTYYDGEKPLGTQEVDYGDSIQKDEADAMANDIASKKQGQKLSGWTTRGTQWDFEKDTVTSNLSLYASWSIEVTFDANGHGTVPAADYLQYGDTVKKPNDPTADGYTFGGWYTDKACTEAYDFTEKVYDGFTLYAKWTIMKHTVTFSANGMGKAPAAKTVNHGAKVTNPGNLTYNGYVFGGWFTDSACKKAYNFSTPVTKDITLYAKWTKYAKPGTVGITSASSPLKNTVAVKWATTNNADGYEVAVGSVITSVNNAKTLSANIVNTKLKAGGKYDVMVRAWHMNGTEKTYGNWSPVKKVTISKYYNATTTKAVKAYKKANTKSGVKASLKKGATVKVLKVSGAWAQTDKGWVQKASLKAAKITNTPKVITSVASSAAASKTSSSASSLMAARIG